MGYLKGLCLDRGNAKKASGILLLAQTGISFSIVYMIKCTGNHQRDFHLSQVSVAGISIQIKPAFQ